MRHPLVAIAAVLGVLLWAPAAAPANAPCKPRGTIVAANDRAVVFKRGDRGETRVFACSRTTGRTIVLGEDAYPTGGRPRKIKLAGRFVAFESHTTMSGGDESLRVVVTDVDRRRRVRRWGFFQSRNAELPRLQIQGSRLRSDGAFTFIAGPEESLPEGAKYPEGLVATYSVHIGNRRRARRVDSGRDVDPQSFRATRTKVSWVRGGQRKTARY